MTNRPARDGREARGHRRAAARLRAQKARAQRRRRQRSARIAVQSGLALVLIAVVTVVAIVLVNSSKPAGPGPDAMSGGGITIGKGLKAVSGSSATADSASAEASGTVSITIYVDYLCPTCGAFERTNGAYIQRLARSGAATVDIHPVAILSSRSQGTKYSLRAANAMACVAQSSPDSFWAAHRALFAHQPEEGGPGLANQEITRLVTGVGGVRHKAAIAKCVDDATYEKWVDEQTTKATDGPLPGTSVGSLTGTPLVLVDGQRYSVTSRMTANDFRAFVLSAEGSSFATDDPSSTPTATKKATPSSSATATPSAG